MEVIIIWLTRDHFFEMDRTDIVASLYQRGNWITQMTDYRHLVVLGTASISPYYTLKNIPTVSQIYY